MSKLVVSQHVEDILNSDSPSETASIIGVSTATAIIISTVSNSFQLTESNWGELITYTGVTPITAWVTSNINSEGYNTTIAQLSSGGVTVALSSYAAGTLISYGDLYETAGSGAVVSITRVSDNKFLITGILQ